MAFRMKLCILILLAGIAVQAREERVRLPSLSTTGSSIELRRAGVRLKPFRGLKSIPIQTMDSFTGRDGEDYYASKALWVREQHIAQLTSVHAYISISDMKYAVSETLTRVPAVTAESFAKIVKEGPMTWEPEALKNWAAAFGGEVKSTETKVGSLSLKYPYTRFTYEGTAPEVAQAFAIKTSDTRFVFAYFKFAPGYKESQVDSAIAKVLKSMSFFKGKADDGPSSKFQQHRGVTRTPRSEKYEAARAKVIQNIGNLKDWWYVETDNYILKSNMTSRNRSLVKKVQENVEILRRSYEVFIPPVKEIEDVSVVTVFNTRQEYLAYVPRNYMWTGGLWIPTRKELVVSPYNWAGKYRKVGLDETLNTVHHEAFHQFLFYALPRIQVPIWFNEGHAVLFEAVKVNRLKKLIEVEENPNYTPVVEKMVKEKKFDLARLIRMERGQFYSGDASKNYAQAWALVYFLRKAGPCYEKSDRKYHLVCDQLLKELKAGKNWQAANEAAFRDIHISRMQLDFDAFWSSSSKRAAARRVRLLTEKEMWKRSQEDAAERLALRKKQEDERRGYGTSARKEPASAKPVTTTPVTTAPGEEFDLLAAARRIVGAKQSPRSRGPKPAKAAFAYNTKRDKTPNELKPPLVKAVKWIQTNHGNQGKIISRAYAKNSDGHRVIFVQVTDVFTGKSRQYREAFTRDLFQKWNASCRESKEVGGRDHVHLVLVDEDSRIVGGMRLKDGSPVPVPPQ